MIPKGRLIPSLLLGLYIAAIAVLCFIKPDNLPSVEKNLFGIPMDKAVHFLMFLPYPAIAFAVIHDREASLKKHSTALASIFIIGLLLAYGTELLQAGTGYRSYETKDFAADAAGMAIGCLLPVIRIICDRYRKK